MDVFIFTQGVGAVSGEPMSQLPPAILFIKINLGLQRQLSSLEHSLLL